MGVRVPEKKSLDPPAGVGDGTSQRAADEAEDAGSPELHAYPGDLAAAVLEAVARRPERVVESPLLVRRLLESVVSTIFQASLLRDEGRPVFFRTLLCPPDTIPLESGPPSALHAVHLDEFRPFDIQEIRRLSNAAPYQRSLLGLCVDSNSRPSIWGVVHSGARWLRVLAGGRASAPEVPRALVVMAGGPGRIEVSLGDEQLARLEGGALGGTTLDVFSSTWFAERFSGIRAELRALHESARESAGGRWAPLDGELMQRIAQHMIRQLIAAVRASRHGGAIMIVPQEVAAQLAGPNPYLRIKYGLADEEPRRRFRTLMLAMMNALAEASGREPTAEPFGWNDYRSSGHPRISDLEEALFELSNLIAGFAAVDGAVVLTNRLEVLGFGAEIAGHLPDVPVVARALDVEGTRWRNESTERLGTRHRSAYRLCAAMPEAIAIIVSQDGGVRFACWKDGAVRDWHHLSSGLVASS